MNISLPCGIDVAHLRNYWTKPRKKSLGNGPIRPAAVRRLEHDPEKWKRFSEKIMLQQDYGALP
ncbi:hypothetical protein MPL3356_80397 [Mesorhizobium plurifarium]|uniref:Uncharacterized protein n=1 Tax=Mesorhizobium plurifarium TaxID=69974 RepID=A0A090EE89_MESPL|nr:hypothetical protein MPL3356_80397 [Mesorhizobium plurifarium]CDX52760.1 hypothetical protein MPL1032_160030 [Mesorhizobium plurifarium]